MASEAGVRATVGLRLLGGGTWHAPRGGCAAMKLERVEETLERIAAAAARTPGGGLACDGDGTRWSGDVGDDLFLSLLAEGGVRPEAREPLERMGAAHGVE